ncbi:peptidase M16 inactive domain protein [Clostridiales bacterium oral taxon 876 str. F0540]|nr:peptidase M16 inactive domain protein [Clostridiales bacterium oral taxon 876 str. F0540]
MKKYILENGLRLIYEYRESNITSFCIGFEAGALMEEGYKLGTAHAVEHMVFKGTKSRSEYEINNQCDEIFGFNNAMTNYPYCIYYGTTLSDDFHKGFELYSDIILNPSFPEEGFKEEINIILEELIEWKDDVSQHCEDMLFHNAFNQRRIKNLIIGTEKSVRSITLQDIKDFYNEFYAPSNCVISVVSSLSSDEVFREVSGMFGSWDKKYMKKEIALYENNNSGIFADKREGIQGSKIQIIFPIHGLDEREINALYLFNTSFGEGTSSLLYDCIRTKYGLVYDIRSTVKYEKGIKLFSINMGTSLQNTENALKLVLEVIETVKNDRDYFSKDTILRNSKIIKLKRELEIEKSIVLSKNMTTNELMFNDFNLYNNEKLDDVSYKEIFEVINKVLINPSIQIINV